METPAFEFTSLPVDRFATVNAAGLPLQAQIIRSLGLLRFWYSQGSTKDFPLVQDDDPAPVAVYLSVSDDGTPQLEVGSADFEDQAEYLEDYALNDTSIQDEWNFDMVDGGLGILDLRNLGRQRKTRYFLDRVPVVLSITGVYLRIATIKRPSDSDMTPWYEVIHLPG